MDILREIICDGIEDGCVGYCNHPYCYQVDKVAEGLKRNNFVQLPARAGQKAWFVIEHDTDDMLIAEGVVYSIIFEAAQTWLYCKYNNGLTYHHTIKDIGKSLFFNREDAIEAAHPERTADTDELTML